MTINLSDIQEWLKPLDSLPLECDGMTRVISALLSREGIDHQVMIGELSIKDVGDIPLHYWIRFPDDTICDYRARMWLGQSEQVPHGVFTEDKHHNYRPAQTLNGLDDPFMFLILTGQAIDDYPLLSTEPDESLRI